MFPLDIQMKKIHDGNGFDENPPHYWANIERAESHIGSPRVMLASSLNIAPIETHTPQ